MESIFDRSKKEREQSMRKLIAALVATILLSGHATVESSEAIVRASGVKGGLVVKIGCGDADELADLRINDRFLVHILDTDAAKVAAARAALKTKDLYGKVSVDSFDGKRLPYVDNLVNLVIADGGCKVPEEEILRILTPRGVAMIDGEKTVKPVPPNIDEWTHYLHGPDNNAVAQDTVVGPPAHIQWVAPPKWSRHHETSPSIFGAVSSKGRLFYVHDEGPIGIVDKRFPDKFSLIARDAFNGMLLWKRPMRSWFITGTHWMRVPQQLNKRLVAIGDRLFVTTGIGERVSMVDAATGETLDVFEGTEDASEILYKDGVLVVLRKPPPTAENRRTSEPLPSAVSAIEVESGKLLWEQGGEIEYLSLAIANEKAFFVVDDHASCVNLHSGKELWRTPFSFTKQGHFPADMGIVIASEDVIVMLKTGTMTAFSAESGRRLWEQSFRSTLCASPQDAFIVDGLVWPGLCGVGYDLLTGKKARTVDNRVIGGHHHRCHLRKATTNYILASQNGVEFFDVQGKNPSIICNTFRGSCRLGVVPCNGLLYLPPNSCKCFIEAQLHGFYALASRKQPARTASVPRARLEQGPAFHRPLGREAGAEDWPAYRHDAKRSGISPSRLPTDLKRVWTVSLGSRITPPVVVGSRVFVGVPERHAIACLDSKSGKKLWEYTAGARIDSPPTYYRGTLLFGSADGWVYSITADQGVLRWRYRCAPDDRLIGACDQLESAWPVSGSILVQNDIAYAAAGRCSMVDGGMYLVAFSPENGNVLHQTVEKDPAVINPDSESTAYYTPGVLSDILVGDGQHVYLRHRKFDRELVKQPDVHIPPTAVRHLLNTGIRLYASAGFTDTFMHQRMYWAVGENFGSMMAFDPETTYGVKMYNTRKGWSPRFEPATKGYLLYAAPTSEWKGEGTEAKKGFDEFFPGMNKTYTWSRHIPVSVRAMAATKDTLFVVGPPDVVDADDPLGAFEGRKGSVIKAFARADGKELAEYTLPTVPVFDGMAVAGGKLFMSCKGSSVVCLGREKGNETLNKGKEVK
jgi:outer membrane protein assembly factor BamB